MNIISYILLAIVIFLFILAARYHHRTGSKKSCCRDRGGDNCTRCTGCEGHK